MQTLKIDLISDVVCPWCAIGFERLRRAMVQLEGELEFEVCWHPFLLNPDVPPEGRDMLDHLGRKYGKTEPEVQASQRRIVADAQALGLNFERATERRSWNTFDTHRVLAWAREQGRDEAFNLALFEAYFGAAKNPTDPALLREIAQSLDLDPATVDAIIDSDRYTEEVQNEIAHFQSLGVSAVPTFIVNDRYLIAGAQPPEAIVDGIRRIAAETPVEA